jgi:hypothetical protein
MATTSNLLHLRCYNVKANLLLPPLATWQQQHRTTNLFSYEFPKKAAVKVTCNVLEKHVIENGRSVVEEEEGGEGGIKKSYTCVMKFGGSSVASAERMMEVAGLVMSFPEERPIVVLSAMGKTTNKLLLVYTYFLYFYT